MTPSLSLAIQAVHQAIADHPDPQAKTLLTAALQSMLKVQAQDLQGGQGPQAQGQSPPSGLAGLFGGGNVPQGQQNGLASLLGSLGS